MTQQPRLPGITPEDARRAGEAFAKILNAQQAHFRRIRDAFRPLLEWVNTPEGQELLAVARAQREREQGCHCLCGLNHPGAWPCEGPVLESEIVTMRFADHDVPMCPSCADAHQGNGTRDVLAEIDAAVRDWENGPDAMRWTP